MKKIVAAALFVTLSFLAVAQSTAPLKIKWPTLDKSPMDMTYYPANYPVLKIQDKTTEPLVARVVYSRPQKDGRVVFGELVEYNQVWRLGANEATEVEFYRDVKIGGKKVAKGRYTLYAVPTATQWTVILNKDTDTWGAFKYDDKKDLLRITVPVQKNNEIVEAFTIGTNKSADGFDLIFAWDDVTATLPVSLK